MSATVSVLDYRVLGDAGQAGLNLQLLVRDDRLPLGMEMDWISAGLAARLWPTAMLEFYLDYVIIRVGEEERKHGEDSDREQEESVEDSLVKSIWMGENQLREGRLITEIVGTLELSWEEWERVWKEIEILECDTLPVEIKRERNDESTDEVKEEKSFDDGGLIPSSDHIEVDSIFVRENLVTLRWKVVV